LTLKLAKFLKIRVNRSMLHNMDDVWENTVKERGGSVDDSYEGS
jgi:hypothetical protein